MRWLSCLVSAVVLGCSGQEYEKPVDGCYAITDATIKRFVACSGASSLGERLRSNLDALCMHLVALEQGRQTVYHRDQAMACIEAIQRRSCSDLLDDAGPVPCAQVFTGTVGIGQDCETGSMCLSQRCSEDCSCAAAGEVGQHCPCKHSLTCRQGLCAEHARIGESCLTSSDCEAGLGCIAGLQQCQPLQTSGECASSSECAPFYACVGAEPEINRYGTCTKLMGEGQPCVSDDDCVTALCESNRCRPLPGNGGACGAYVNGHSYVACATGWCDDGKCTAPVQPGGSCDPSIRNQCTPTNSCGSEGFCKPLACY